MCEAEEPHSPYLEQEETMRLPTFSQGVGPTVVMVHGRGEAHDSWLPVLPYLDGYRVIRVDLIGFGSAPAPKDPERYTIEAGRDDLAETLSDLDGPFALVGHSMGGMIAASYAADYGDQLAALILESTAGRYPYTDEHYPQQRAFLYQLADLLEEEGVEGAVARLKTEVGLDSKAEEILRRTPAHVLTASIRQNANMKDVHARLSTFKAPSLIVAGANDGAFLPWCERLATTLPNGELRIIPEAGHSPHAEATEAFCAALRPFLDEHLAS
jgi:pimeloyl-ACP methyl ester carboxylesterase